MKKRLLAPGLALMAQLNYVQRFTLIGLLVASLVVVIELGVRDMFAARDTTLRALQRSRAAAPLLHLMQLTTA